MKAIVVGDTDPISGRGPTNRVVVLGMQTCVKMKQNNIPNPLWHKEKTKEKERRI